MGEFHLEVSGPQGRRLVALDGEKITIGRAPDADVPVTDDPGVSRLHAVLECYGAGWCVRDLGSRNGTFVNGEAIWADRVLRLGDEVRVGHTRLVLAGLAQTEPMDTVVTTKPVPSLTPRERDVLVALCRPVLVGTLFTEPASVSQIAEVLVVTEAAVRQHLIRLYDKFAIHDSGERRRLRLANEVIGRGAVSLSDLRNLPPRASAGSAGNSEG